VPRGNAVLRWVFVLASLAATPASAATPEQLAAKELAAADRQVRATFRAALAAAQIQLSAAIANVELSLATSSTPLLPAETLFDALVAFQTTIFAAGNAAGTAHAEGARDALATLGTMLHGVYPEAFYPGDGTATARFETALATDTNKAYTKLRKQLGRVAARFASKGFALGFRVRPPRTTAAVLWSEAVTNSFPELPPTIDVAISFSDLAVAGDGQIRVAGTGTVIPVPDNGPIGVGALGQPDSAILQTRSVVPEGGRWRTNFDLFAFGEAVYLLSTFQQTIEGEEITLGVR
jgi:hypothetical protein